jgi:hypothetical protein
VSDGRVRRSSMDTRKCRTAHCDGSTLFMRCFQLRSTLPLDHQHLERQTLTLSACMKRIKPSRDRCCQGDMGGQRT